MTIYQTFYDPAAERKLATEPSTDSGIDSFADVEAVMGEPIERDPFGRYVLYADGLCFSTFACL